MLNIYTYIGQQSWKVTDNSTVAPFLTHSVHQKHRILHSTKLQQWVTNNVCHHTVLRMLRSQTDYVCVPHTYCCHCLGKYIHTVSFSNSILGVNIYVSIISKGIFSVLNISS